MPTVTVCVRFRPVSSKEERLGEGKICVHALDAKCFVFKDDKEEESAYCFDKVFYKDSEQEDVYDFLVRPIVQGAINAINGTVIVYGQTGAGKTYTMEGPGVLDDNGRKRGILPRVVWQLFESVGSANELDVYTIKVSMVEIYMERVRDLFDLSKDNLQIKESTQGLYLAGATEISILEPEGALDCLARGIANRKVGQTQMNMSSSRSHCIYIFLIQKESPREGRIRKGKVVLLDLAGSEKVEKTGAEGKILEEAKTINKSLSALGNVINCLTTGKVNHVPYRDSKLTRILQDSLGGNSQCALLCCCSPSSLNASESLSTLRFGTRCKLLQTTLPMSTEVETAEEKLMVPSLIWNIEVDTADENLVDPSLIRNTACNKILEKLKESLRSEDVRLLEELFILEGLLYDPQSVEELQTLYEDTISRTIPLLEQTVKDLRYENKRLKMENDMLTAALAASLELNMGMGAIFKIKFSDIVSFLYTIFKFPAAVIRRTICM